MDLFFWCPGLICRVSWSNLQGDVEFSHRGGHRGRHGGAERTSCAKRADNERTTCTRAVRFGSVRCSVGVGSLGWLGSVGVGSLGGVGSVGVGSLGWLGSVGVGSLGWLGSVGVGSLGGVGSACGWRIRPIPPSAAPSVAGAQPSHPLTLAPSHPLARPRTPSLAPCAFTAAVARRRVSLPLPSVGRCAAPRSLVGRLYLPVATALLPGAPAARLRPACFTARLGRAVALGN